MSRRALWPPPAGADPATLDGADHSPAAAHTGAHGASGGVLPGRSSGVLPVGTAVAAQVKLARLADLLAELAEVVRGIAQESLDLHAERALMCSVNEPASPARLMSVRDVAQKLALSERTVRRLRRRGVLPAGIEVAGVIRWTPESIDAWVASGGGS